MAQAIGQARAVSDEARIRMVDSNLTIHLDVEGKEPWESTWILPSLEGYVPPVHFTNHEPLSQQQSAAFKQELIHVTDSSEPGSTSDPPAVDKTVDVSLVEEVADAMWDSALAAANAKGGDEETIRQEAVRIYRNKKKRKKAKDKDANKAGSET